MSGIDATTPPAAAERVAGFFSKLLSRPRPPAEQSSAELRATLADAEAALAAARERVDALAEGLGAVLLSADAAAIEAHKAQQRAAADDWSRCKAVIPAVRDAINLAEAREADARASADAAEAERIATATASDMRQAIALARDLLAALGKAEAETRNLAAVNARLHAAGRGDLAGVVPLPEPELNALRDTLSRIGAPLNGISRHALLFDTTWRTQHEAERAARQAEARKRAEAEAAALNRGAPMTLWT